VLRLIDKYVCVFVCVYLSGESHGKESKEKTNTWPRQSNNTKSLEKRELLNLKEKENARVGYLGGLSTPANEKLLSVFHHTHRRESFFDIPI
jgi:hypothetical protein